MWKPFCAEAIYEGDYGSINYYYYGSDSSTAITEAEYKQLWADLEYRAEDFGDNAGMQIREWNPNASEGDKRVTLLEAYMNAPLHT